MVFPERPLQERTIEDYAILPMSVTRSLSTFIRSLPAFQTLPRPTQKVLCEANLRRLIPLNLYELNQSCFSEPQQVIVVLCLQTIDLVCLDCKPSNRLGIHLWS